MAEEKEVYTMEPHHFGSSKRTPFITQCWQCGLVAANNEFTQWAMRTGCNHKLHPSYKSKRSLTNPFK